MLHDQHEEVPRLLLRDLAAESKGDVIFFTFPGKNPTAVVFCFFCGSLSCFLHRLYFALKKKASALSVTVSPCDLPVEWSLAARTLKDKPHKSLQCE